MAGRVVERFPAAHIRAGRDCAVSIAWRAGNAMKRVAIVGGGISGLAAALALEKQKKASAALEYVLFESSTRFGGVIQTENVDGCVIEAGPDSFLTEKPWAA